ncbi:uncharacterized protein LOC124195368 [Daphnia pulex]|uniref:uncharacterized protein LOC124195368 n=1 Tax=Daphnia pulex TaxID=6669 RepID=UPI001EDD1926|nr:uncharacterized protein LOC124195368 [Daphnia pulex]
MTMSNSEDFTPLLLRLKEPDFIPTLVFEKRFVELFCNKLNQIFEARSSGKPNHSIATISDRLDCVLLIAEKDKQFIPLFGTSDSLCGQITNSLRSELIESQSLVPLHIKVLHFISLILQHIPTKKSTFVSLGLHRLLLLKPAVLNHDLIMWRIDILDKLCDVPIALQEISSVNALELLFCFLGCFIENNESGCNLNDIDLLKSLLTLICKITNDVSLHNSNHLRKFDEVFLQLARVYPELEEVIQGVYKLVCEAMLSSSRPSSKSTKKSCFSITHSRISKQRPNVFQYSLSIMDFKPTPSINLTITGFRSAKSDAYSVGRYMFVDMDDMDMEVDAISLEKSVELIDMTTTAEVICGMLNSNKGGTIHFGLTSSGRIDGLLVNHERRDGLRGGVDNLFLNQLSPLLPTSLVNIVFIPVREENMKTISPNHSLYVVRIVVPARMNTLYHLKNRDISFVRRPEGNVQLSLKDVRQLAVELSEKKFVSTS